MVILWFASVSTNFGCASLHCREHCCIQGGGHSGELKCMLWSLQNQSLRLKPQSQQSLILYLLLCLFLVSFYS